MSGETDTLVGTTLEGRFRIERLLGEGGMGRVYIADETRLRRRCAVKVLLPELSQDKDNVERFLREAQSIAQIHHENVVDIHHLGEDADQGVVFFAMELLSGEDLEMRLADRKKRPIAWLDVVRWMAMVAGAMGAVHAAGLIHRDLKPSNIFLNRRRDGREQVKLLDFGIAKGFNRSALTGTGAALGTPYYMSPEQILAEQLDPRSDIYSLGVLFFEALAGRMPFIGEPIQVAMQHCNVLPPRPTDVTPDLEIPGELEALVMAMLEKGRDVRIQSMEEVEQRLMMFLPSTGSSMITGPLSRPLTFPPNSEVLQSGLHEPPPSARSSAQMSTAPTGQLPAGPRTDARSLEIHFDTTPDAADAETKTNTSPTPVRMPQQRMLLIAAAGAAVLVLVAIVIAMSGGSGETPKPPETPVATPAKEPVVTAPVTPPTKNVAPPDPTGATPTTNDTAGNDTAAADSAGNDTADSGDKPPDGPITTPTKKPPVDPAKIPEKKEKDPIKQIQSAAAKCRKTHKAVGGPKITIRYDIASDGSIKKATTSGTDALSKCLSDAVARVKFPPKLALGQKIDL